jgi:hypothetical protein
VTNLTRDDDCWQFQCKYEIGPLVYDASSGSIPGWDTYPFPIDHVYINCDCL